MKRQLARFLYNLAQRIDFQAVPLEVNLNKVVDIAYDAGYNDGHLHGTLKIPHMLQRLEKEKSGHSILEQ